MMEHEDLTHKIIGCAYQVYNQLKYGFLESVYKRAMIIELAKNNLKVEAEKPLKVYYDNQIIGDFYIDLFVENSIIVELKSVQNIAKEHEVQLVTYLNGNFPITSGNLFKKCYRHSRERGNPVFFHFHPETGKKDPDNPVNPV